MSAIKQLNYSELNEYFDYNSATGTIHRKKAIRRHRAGEEVGCVDSNGRKVFSWKNKNVYLSRVAYVLFHGKEPENFIDHIDGDKLNNKIENLRDVTCTQNQWNRKERKTKSGYSGVYPDGQKFMARICCDGERHYLGMFDMAEEAYKVVKAAKKKYFKEYRRQ